MVTLLDQLQGKDSVDERFAVLDGFARRLPLPAHTAKAILRRGCQDSESIVRRSFLRIVVCSATDFDRAAFLNTMLPNDDPRVQADIKTIIKSIQSEEKKVAEPTDAD